MPEFEPEGDDVDVDALEAELDDVEFGEVDDELSIEELLALSADEPDEGVEREEPLAAPGP